MSFYLCIHSAYYDPLWLNKIFVFITNLATPAIQTPHICLLSEALGLKAAGNNLIIPPVLAQALLKKISPFLQFKGQPRWLMNVTHELTILASGNWMEVDLCHPIQNLNRPTAWGADRWEVVRERKEREHQRVTWDNG